MNRRHFLNQIAIGIGCLTLRFRIEAAGELYPRLIDEGEWAGMRWQITTAWTPVNPTDIPLILPRREPNYYGTLEFVKPTHTYLGNWRLAREDK